MDRIDLGLPEGFLISLTKLTGVSQGQEDAGNDRTGPFPQPQLSVTR